MSGFKFATLIHMVKWELEQETVDLGSGIEIGKVEGSRIEELYHHLCEQENVDQGDPFNYLTYFSYVPQDPIDSYISLSDTARVCSLIALTLGCPLGMCRRITTRDNFKSADFSEVICDYHFFQEEMSLSTALIINKKNIVELKALHTNLGTVSSNNSLVSNALSYFFYAWSAPIHEQSCINMCIVLEAIFSPSSNSELSHRIAFNACHFLGESVSDRMAIYKTIKKFYDFRSKIVHGEVTDFDKLIEITPRAYSIINSALKKILLDEELIKTFDSKKRRNDLFERWLFR